MENFKKQFKSEAEIASERANERAKYFEGQMVAAQKESKYYQEELVKAHTLIGRIVHQLSERWDKVNLTKYFPTDNLSGKRTINNPEGK